MRARSHTTPGGTLRRTIAVIAAGAVVALTAAGCGSSSGSSSGGGTLTVYMYGDGADGVQQTVVDDFNKTSQVKVKMVDVPGTDYVEKLRSAMSSSEAPDVFFNWGGGSILPYEQNGLLLNLTPYFNEAPLKGAFLPAIVSAGAINGQDYGVPMRGMQPVILFYNKALFAQYNLQTPDTWAAMQAAITTFKAHGIIPFALGASDNWPSLMWLEYLTDRIGGPSVFTDIQDGDAAGWTSPVMTAALNQAKSLISEGAFGSNFTSTGYDDNAAPTLLGTGRAAMQLMGSWDYSNQLTNHSSFAANDEAWTTFPAVPGGTGNPADVVGNPTNYWSINAHTKYQSTAVAFVTYMTQSSYATSLLANGSIPTNSDAASLIPKFPQPAFAGFQFQMVQNAPAFQLSWDQALPSTVGTPLDTEVGKFFDGQVSAQQFESDMEALQKSAS